MIADVGQDPVKIPFSNLLSTKKAVNPDPLNTPPVNDAEMMLAENTFPHGPTTDWVRIVIDPVIGPIIGIPEIFPVNPVPMIMASK
jgi:hypothetical protein